MNENDLVVDWKDIQHYWRNNFSSRTDISLQRYLEPGQLFSSGNTMGYAGIPLYHGIHKMTKEHRIHILVSHAHQLVDLMVRDLAMDQVPDIPLTMTESKYDYESTERIMTDRTMYQKLAKQVTQANKRQRKWMEAKMGWQQAKRLLREKQYVFVSLDIEAYEADHSILLEIGWTLYDSRHNKYLDQHYMMLPYRHLTNGKYVDDQRLSFAFGTSIWCTLQQALDELYKDLAWATERDGGFVLVGHGLNSDLLYLKQCKFAWPVLENNTLASTLDVDQSALVTIVNTDTLYGAYVGDMHNPPSLGRCLTLMDIDHFCLHNAGNNNKKNEWDHHSFFLFLLFVQGNDAHYTMALMMKLLDKEID
ncbi:uncharacterized protein BX664DRAFT_293328 [Halteromyces radiatus]|uniref:uncharacterized protein n=1 Tax=Halteromyces radiatus TaxID=101107 RepID=UPI00221FE364|nr:uncharacterized protein BX664DRAFT_293328 [Halteromyces radiatus]KAI8097669.1 hypothetical protein BX664DRAFT_293328 [Halteromyces radiatus]